MIATRTLAVTVVLCVVSPPVAIAQQSKEAERFLVTYRPYLKLLHDRYSRDRRIRFRAISQVATGEQRTDGKRVGDTTSDATFEVVTDGRQYKKTLISKSAGTAKDVVDFWRPDMMFGVARVGPGHKMVDQLVVKNKNYLHEFAQYSSYAFVPFALLEVQAPFWYDDQGQKSIQLTPVAVRTAEWEGRPAVEVKVKWDNRGGLVRHHMVYLDPARDYIAVGAVGDWYTDPQIPDWQRVQYVDYRPSDEGFPLPKALRMYTRQRDGRTDPSLTIEFLAYDRYTPTADEFALEKYGLVTPAEIPTAPDPLTAPPPPPAQRWWAWVIVGVGLICGLAAVALLRRRRA